MLNCLLDTHNTELALTLFSACFVLILAPYTIRSMRQDGTPIWLTKIQKVQERSSAESVEEVEGYRQQKLVDPVSVGSESELVEPGILTFSINHFMHNEITSVLIIPLNWPLLTLESAVEQLPGTTAKYGIANLPMEKNSC